MLFCVFCIVLCKGKILNWIFHWQGVSSKTFKWIFSNNLSDQSYNIWNKAMEQELKKKKTKLIIKAKRNLFMSTFYRIFLLNSSWKHGLVWATEKLRDPGCGLMEPLWVSCKDPVFYWVPTVTLDVVYFSLQHGFFA